MVGDVKEGVDIAGRLGSLAACLIIFDRLFLRAGLNQANAFVMSGCSHGPLGHVDLEPRYAFHWVLIAEYILPHLLGIVHHITFDLILTTAGQVETTLANPMS